MTRVVLYLTTVALASLCWSLSNQPQGAGSEFFKASSRL
jgi:hypothetical protein